MKYANHIILIILWTFIINAVLSNLALDAKSIMAGEWVELYLYKTGHTTVEGKLLLRDLDSVGVLHDNDSQSFYPLGDIYTISTHRRFSDNAIGKGTGFGAIVGSAAGFLVISTSREKNYAATIIYAMVGSIVGLAIGAFVSENMIINRRNMFIAYETIEDSPPEYAEYIKCGEKVEIKRRGVPFIYKGILQSIASDSLKLINEIGTVETFTVDEISKACVRRPDLKKGAEEGFAYGLLAGTMINVFHFGLDSGDLARSVAFDFGGGLLGAIIGLIYHPDRRIMIDIDNSWQMPRCHINPEKRGG